MKEEEAAEEEEAEKGKEKKKKRRSGGSFNKAVYTGQSLRENMNFLEFTRIYLNLNESVFF